MPNVINMITITNLLTKSPQKQRVFAL